MTGNLLVLRPCDKKTETAKSGDNQNKLGKSNNGKQTEKKLDWNKVAYCRTRDRCIESDMESKCVEGHDCQRGK